MRQFNCTSLGPVGVALSVTGFELCAEVRWNANKPLIHKTSNKVIAEKRQDSNVSFGKRRLWGSA